MNIWQTFLNFLDKQELEIPEYVKDGFGMIEVAPTEEDYVLGGKKQALKIILSPERDYTDWLPAPESQKRGYDSFSCVVFSGLNNLEIIFKKQFGFEINWSDRYLAALTPVKPGRGTSYRLFWDAVRKYGLVLEEELPWGGKSGYEYVSKKAAEPFVPKGKLFVDEYDIQHEWVDSGGCDPNVLYEALQYGPLQASVNGAATYTKKRDRRINHSITIYKAIKGKKFYILDHYTRETYDLPWNFHFGSAKQASLIKKKIVQLVQMPYLKDRDEAAKIYAIYGTTACHISDEYTWHYGDKIGIWKAEKIIGITKRTFDNRFVIGDQLSFKNI